MKNITKYNPFILDKESKVFYKKIWRLAPPVIMAEILNSLINILDTVMIGRAMGINEVTGVAMANQIFFIFVVVFWGIVGGCGIFIGQYYGKGEMSNIIKTVGLGITCTLTIAVIFFIPSFFFAEFVIGIFTRDPVVVELGASFLRVMSFCYFFVAISFARNGCMRNLGQTKIPMVTTSIALILNIFFNYVLIFVFNSPIEMVAVGTVVARFIELCLQQYFIKKYKIPISGSFKQYLSFDRAFVKKFFKISSFLILGLATWSIGTSIYNVAYSFAGTNAQGAVKISTSMMQLFSVFGFSLGVATQIIMTNTLGAGQRELAIRYSRMCITTAFLISTVMALALMVLAPYIVMFFGADEDVSHYVLILTYIYSFSLILRGINFVNMSGVLRSGGDTKFQFILDIVGVWIIGIPVAFVCALYFNMPIYWIVFFVHIEEVFKLIAGTYRVLSNKWANRLV